MRLFKRQVAFRPIDPLGDGLGDLINESKSRPDRIILTEAFDGEELARQWEDIHQDLIKDPLWFNGN